MKQRRFRQSAARAGAVALEPRTFLSAGPASLVKDVNPITLSSNPDYHVQLGDVLLFRADDGVHGNEWFVSDGTAGGTTLLKDINPGAASSLSPVRTPDVYFNRMAVVGDTLYFTADEGTASGRAGVELWKTDGTPTGTVRVKDIAPGPSGSLPEFLTAVGDALYFRATEPSAGAELWTSDGTEGGTRRVADIVPGVGGPGPVPLAGLGGRLILSAWSPTDGYELWSSDGTAAGTTLLKNINPAGASDPGINSFVQLGGRAEAVVVGGEVYFAARDAEFGRELWKTDGTADGTVRVTDLPALNAEPQHLMDVSGKAYFVNYPVQGQGTPKTVYRVDSSLPGGVDPIGQIDWGNVHEAHLGVVGGKLYFAGPSQDKIGLFTHDPASPAGTQMSFVKALPFFSNVTATGLFADVGGVAYFRSHVSDLWRSDGTEAGTQQVFESRPRSPIQTESASRWRVVSGPGDALYFTADDPATGTELYRWDGTPNGTGRMLDLNTITANGVTTVGAPLPDGRLLFAGNDGSRGTELWVTDGTEAGTRLLKEVWPGELSGVVTGPAVVPNETRLGAAFNGRVYFSAGHLDGRELWASDGTEAGTVMVKDINPGVGSSSPEEFTIFRGRLYFRASAGLVDRELWSTDGTAGGTVRVKDINLDGASDPSRLTVVGDMMYFTAFENEHGRELWKTDGTDAGTVLVANITGGAFSSDPQSLTAWQGKLFFSAITSPEGRELWVSDGTGATLVRDLTPTAANFDSIPLKLTPAKLGLLFEAGPTNARDIYVSDGTGDNTVRLRDLGGGSGTSLGTLTLLGVLDGWAYFFNVYPGELPGTLWMELWKSDGGPMAAQKVATLLGPGSPLGNTQALGEADGFLYFRMQSPLGIELWRTDGTEAGTATVQDVFPGTGHGSPVNFATAGGRVYFTANDGTHGGELWSMLARPVERAEPGVVYRGSRFDDAVAPDKAALRAGGTVSTANVTSYDRGINQVVVEMPGGLPGGVTADDFVFRVGRGGDPATWPIAPAPTSVELLPRVLGESPRYRITWTDGAIRNNWLQVTVKDNGRTGLARPDVFYFGNLVGETVATIGGAAAVGPSDYAATRAAIGRRGGIADPADHNRDGRVDLRDLVLVRRNYFQTLTPIEAAPATLTSAPRRLAVRRAWEGVDTVPAGVR